MWALQNINKFFIRKQWADMWAVHCNFFLGEMLLRIVAKVLWIYDYTKPEAAPEFES